MVLPEEGRKHDVTWVQGNFFSAEWAFLNVAVFWLQKIFVSGPKALRSVPRTKGHGWVSAKHQE